MLNVLGFEPRVVAEQLRHSDGGICTVSCVSCGGTYEMTRHSMRLHVRQGTEPRCRNCRRSDSHLQPHARFEAQAWALQQLLDRPAAELRAIAHALEHANWC